MMKGVRKELSLGIDRLSRLRHVDEYDRLTCWLAKGKIYPVTRQRIFRPNHTWVIDIPSSLGEHSRHNNYGQSHPVGNAILRRNGDTTACRARGRGWRVRWGSRLV